jgi:hypothetical protein
MPKQLAVVMIHGIGRQRPDYAARMIRNIEQQLVVQGYEPIQSLGSRSTGMTSSRLRRKPTLNEVWTPRL